MGKTSKPTGASAKRASSAPDADIIEAEVLIIGGGLVGATLATALGQAGLDVCVVDLADPKANLDAGFDGRASAIALARENGLPIIVFSLDEPGGFKGILAGEGTYTRVQG